MRWQFTAAGPSRNYTGVPCSQVVQQHEPVTTNAHNVHSNSDAVNHCEPLGGNCFLTPPTQRFSLVAGGCLLLV